MQHTRPPQLPLCSSFKKHRSITDRSRFSIDLTLPKPIAAPVWASLPTPPMSGSPPPEPPAEPPQIAGRRRKRSLTPPAPTTTTITAPPATTAVVASPLSPQEHTAPRLPVQTRVGETIADLSVQPGGYAPNYPPPSSYQSSSTQPAASVSGPESRYVLSPISPRATRKPKAHVASACINCKKKHLRCDNSRPCRRCVQSGKEDSCIDVEHKKRGRPPLKPDDASSRRPFESALNPVTGSLGEPTRRYTSSDPSSYAPSAGYQPLRPLQAWDPTRGPPGRPRLFPLPAQPSISQSFATAEGTFARPGQFGAAPQQIPGRPLSGYAPSASEASLRSFAYGSYNYPPPQGAQMGPPPPQSRYSNPIFPRPSGSSGPPEPLPPMQGSSGIQLPPILPAPPGPGPIDPAIVQQQHAQQQAQQHNQQSRGDQDSRDDGTRERDPKRPKMDIKGILGPRNE